MVLELLLVLVSVRLGEIRLVRLSFFFDGDLSHAEISESPLVKMSGI